MSRGRLAGALYLLSAVPAGFSVSVFLRLFDRKDAAATAAHVLASEGLFRLAYAGEIVGVLLFVAAIVLMAGTFGGRMGLVFGLLGAGIQALDALADIAALLVLKGGGAPATAQLLLRMHMQAYDLALAFFGVWCLLTGAAIARGRVVPRLLGAFLALDGLGYLVMAFAVFLAPGFAVRISPPLPYATALLGEGSLVFWLLVKGTR